MKKGFIEFDGGIASADPAVAALLGLGQKRQEQSRLPQKEKAKRVKEREKARARNRVVYDLPAALQERVKLLAAKIECPESQVATLLMAHGLRALEAGGIDLLDYKQPSRSPKFTWNLVIETSEFIESKGHPLPKQGTP